MWVCTKKKVDEQAACAKFGITALDTDKAFKVEQIKVRSQILARELKSGDRPELYAGALSLEVWKAVLSTAANHWRTFGILHIDVSRA